MDSFLRVDTLDKLIDLSNKWKEKEFGMDTEFTNLSYKKQNLIGISMYTDNHTIPSVFIEFNFASTYMVKEKDPNNARKKIDVTLNYERTDAIDIEEAKPYLLKIFDGAKCVTANGKVEIKVLNKYGIGFEIIDDVNLMNWLLDVSTPSDLKSAGKRELGIDMPSYEDTVGMKVTNIDWNKVDFYEYAKYGARDAWVTWNLRPIFRQRIEADEPLLQCYLNLELPLIKSVAKTEMAGVEIDCKILNDMSKRISVDIETEKDKVFDMCGVEFNIDSNKQLAEVLFDRLGYPIISETKAGGRAVGEPVLQELAYQGYPVAEALLDYRQLQKLKNTYIDKLPLMVDTDNRLRGGFNQAGTETGRFSSSNPNLQNIPNSSKYPVKQAFIAKKGYSLLVLDWSTIEIRVMAHESKDPVMMDILRNFRDVHQETADNINKQTGLSLKRSDGKTVNFAILYGMAFKSLAYRLNKELKKLVVKGTMTQEEYEEKEVSEATAKQIIDGYYASYSGFTEWGKEEVENTKHTGWVYTFGGRRRRVPELAHRKTYGSGVRKTVNTIIQGGAGDIMKLAIMRLDDLYRDKKLDAQTLLYVHDEFVIEVHDSQREECLKLVMDLMQNIFPKCLVPILCEGNIFDNWDGLKSKSKPKSYRGGNGYMKLKMRKIIK